MHTWELLVSLFEPCALDSNGGGGLEYCFAVIDEGYCECRGCVFALNVAGKNKTGGCKVRKEGREEDDED